jgi:IrrE N-terminal-like domain
MSVRKKGRKVPPLKTLDIRETANYFRKKFGLGTKKFDMIIFVELILPKILPDFYYEVLEKNEMGSDEARTYPDKFCMQIRTDIYDAASNGDRRAQFTLAHELGHLILHTGIDKYASFARSGTDHKIYEDSEWQADTFASEFLMPFDEAIKCKSVNEIFNNFGVSITAAEVRFRKIN